MPRAKGSKNKKPIVSRKKKEAVVVSKLNCEKCSHPLEKHAKNGCQFACACTRKA